VWERAEDETLAADLFLVLGSSLVVHPAAGLPRMAWEAGTPLIIVNREPTPLDRIASLTLHEEIGPLLREAVQAVLPDWGPSADQDMPS
jgi:NAD-dependent deacetylase